MPTQARPLFTALHHTMRTCTAAAASAGGRPHEPPRVRRFKLTSYIAGGAFGQVYAAEDADTGEPAAVKREVVGAKHTTGAPMPQQLTVETAVYHALAGVPGVPRMLGACATPTYNALVLQPMHYTWEDLAAACPGGRMSGEAAVMLAVGALSTLEGVAAAGMVHRDIKPANLMVNVSSPRRVYLVDWGMAAQWWKGTTGGGSTGEPRKWRPRPAERRPACQRVGTPLYSSAAVHERWTPARRDDVAAVALSAMALCVKSLPWTPAPRGTTVGSEAYHAALAQAKRAGVPGAPLALNRLLAHANAYACEDAPDYAALREDLLRTAGLAWDDVHYRRLEWEALLPETYRRPLHSRRSPVLRAGHSGGSNVGDVVDVPVSGVATQAVVV